MHPRAPPARGCLFLPDRLLGHPGGSTPDPPGETGVSSRTGRGLPAVTTRDTETFPPRGKTPAPNTNPEILLWNLPKFGKTGYRAGGDQHARIGWVASVAVQALFWSGSSVPTLSGR